MKGFYRVYQNGRLVREQENLITTEGRRMILNYLSETSNSFAESIAIGTVSTAPTVNDNRLGFELGRGDIDFRVPEYTSGQITFRAGLDPSITGTVHELGVFSQSSNSLANYPSQLLTTFEDSIEDISGGGPDFTKTRAGTSSYRVTAAAGASTTARIINSGTDLSGYQTTDVFGLTCFINDANTSSIQVRAGVDSTNYYRYNIIPGTTLGYRLFEWNKADFVAVGTPDWELITEYSFIVTAGAAATAVNLDGLKIDDTDFYAEYGMTSRAVLTSPIVTGTNEQLDIEYVVEFNL